MALAFPVCVIGATPALDDTDEPMGSEWGSNTPGTPSDFPLFGEDDFVEVYDPLEPINRGMFWFNDKVYLYALKPVARVYRYVPEDLRVAVKNFFINLQAPIRIVNDGLQGKFAIAGNELTRFLTNSTLGIGGLFDPAREHFDLKLHDEDTGQTLGYYGVGPGPYLVLPLLGPSNLRDGIGGIADTYLDLAWYFWGKDAGEDNYDYIGARTLNAINEVSLDKDTYENIKKDALDPYLFIRDAHAQLRRNRINN
jgi:phospholipid-binding lipoprotein MlaA